MGSNCFTNAQILTKYPTLSITAATEKYKLCQSTWITTLSYANKLDNEDFLYLQSLMNISTALVIIVALQLFRKEQRTAEIECDENNITCGDFGIWIKNIRTDKPGEYHKGIIDAFKNKGYTVATVTLAYDLREYYNIITELEKTVILK